MFSINLVFVDAQTMRRLNKKYRNIDKATTVLSFYYGAPSVVLAKGGGPSKLKKGQVEERLASKVHFPRINERGGSLAEILICTSEAKKKNLSIERLVIHGLKSVLSQIPSPKNI